MEESTLLDPSLWSSTEEIVSELLGVCVEKRTECPLNAMECEGSQLAMKIDGALFEIGILSKPGSAEQISNMMLGLEDDEESLTGEEILDAIGELANMIAGRIKGNLANDGRTVELATPQDLAHDRVPKHRSIFHSSEFEFSVFLSLIQEVGE